MRIVPSKRPFRVSLGDRGEMMASDYLLKAGYELIEKNYRCPLGEIDLIASKKGRLVFFEVKTRSSHQFGSPEEAVHRNKQRRLARLAQYYLKDKKWTETPMAFGVVAITCYDDRDPQIRLIENAFSLDETLE